MINVNLLSLLVVMIKHNITGKKRTRYTGDKFAFSELQQMIAGVIIAGTCTKLLFF